MDSVQIESFAVNEIRNSILLTSYIKPYIAENDREPTWDGSLYIYNDKNCKKDTLKGRLAVQVKGKEFDDLSKDEISYSISVVDLKNYLNDGGAVLFVVYIAKEGLAKKIYYIELTPIKLRNELKIAKDNKTKTLKLKAFPTDNDKKVSIITNCYLNCKKQNSFSNGKLKSLEELKKLGILDSIIIPVSYIGNKDSIQALFDSEVYLYANIKGCSIPQPLELIPGDIHTKQTVNTNVSIGEKQFYSSIDIIQSANETKYIFGESFTITFCHNSDDNICDIKYKNSNNIRTIATDLDFMVSYIETGYFLIDKHKEYFDYDNADFSNFNIEEQKETLKKIKDIVNLLDILGCNKDISLKDISDDDWFKLDILIRGLIHKNTVNLNLSEFSPINAFNICNLKFLIYLHKVENEPDKYSISDYFTTEIPTFVEIEGEKIETSQFCIMKRDDFNSYDNLKCELFLPSFKKAKHCNEIINQTNSFLLELLAAYDESKNEELLITAKAFSDYLCDVSSEELTDDVKALNKLQVIKRMRSLNPEEIRLLNLIITSKNSTDEVRFGACLLSEKQDLAELYFERLDKSSREKLKTYPIYNFWKTNKNSMDS